MRAGWHVLVEGLDEVTAIDNILKKVLQRDQIHTYLRAPTLCLIHQQGNLPGMWINPSLINHRYENIKITCDFRHCVEQIRYLSRWFSKQAQTKQGHEHFLFKHTWSPISQWALNEKKCSQDCVLRKFIILPFLCHFQSESSSEIPSVHYL